MPADAFRTAVARLVAEAQHRELTARVANAQHLAHMGDYDWHIATDRNTWSDELYRIYGHVPQSFNASYERFLALVREHLPLPRGAAVRIRIGDAREGLKRLPPALHGQCDLVVSDVFSGAQTPAHLTSVEFYREISELLAPAGVLLVNVADGPGLAFARRQVATAATVFPEVALLADTQVLKGRRFGNLVLAASALPLPTDWLPRMLAAGPHPAKIAQGEEVAAFARGAAIVTDADAVASPRPDSSLFLR